MVRNWMFLYFFVAPLSVLFAVCITLFSDPSLGDITRTPVYLFCSITVSLLSDFFLSHIQRIWNNKNGIKLAEISFCLILIICGYLFQYIIRYAIEHVPILRPDTLFGLTDINIEPTLRWYERKAVRESLDETDIFSTTRYHRKDGVVVSELNEDFYICRGNFTNIIGEDLKIFAI